MDNEEDEWVEPEIPDELRELFKMPPLQSGGGFWILKKGRLELVDFLTWAMWMESPERVVDKTVVSDEVDVSTVFVGLDFNFSGKASGKKHRPYCWETLIRGGPYCGRLWRYATRGDAKRGHWQVVDALKTGQEPKPARGMRSGFDLLRDLVEGRFDPAEFERELEEGTDDAAPE